MRLAPHPLHGVGGSKLDIAEGLLGILGPMPMTLSYTPEAEAFRGEVRSGLDEGDQVVLNPKSVMGESKAKTREEMESRGRGTAPGGEGGDKKGGGKKGGGKGGMPGGPPGGGGKSSGPAA